MKTQPSAQEVSNTTQLPEVKQMTTRTVRLLNDIAVKERFLKVHETNPVLFRTYQVVWYVLGAIEVLLGLRIGLNIMGTNPLSASAGMIRAMSDPFILPSQGVLGAMLFYLVAALGIIEILKFIRDANVNEVMANADSM